MRTALLCLLPVLLLAAGCSSHPSVNAPTVGRAYRVTWTVRRAADNQSLAGVASPPVRVGGGELRVRTGSQRAAENRPAFPEFLVKLSPMRRSTQIELKTRVTVLEARRTKKGKLKVSKRYIGALLPMRPGEKLGVNGPGDPLAVEVELGGGGTTK
ncbi:MAG: hypothetical protein INR65_10785 [Gluconacetobacter diazotrophicus]|nr:hypothetical protein [Gluconacetobacter diazotrophicus]